MNAVPALLPGLASHPYAYPLLEVVHLAGIAVLLGNLLLFELRLVGWIGARLPVALLAPATLGLAIAGFAVAAASGLLMFASQPGELLANRVFVWKMGLLALAGANAGVFHLAGGPRRADRGAKVQAVLSLLLWFAILACGRWIAYA